MINVHFTVLFLSILMVIGCEGNSPFERESNPLVDYPDVQDDVSVRPEAADPQATMLPSYSMEVIGLEVDEAMTFTRGQTGTYDIRVTNNVPQTEFSVVMLQNADGSEGTNCAAGLACLNLTEQTSDTQIYTLTWTPDTDFQADFQEFQNQIRLEFVVGADSSPRAIGAHSIFEKQRTFTTVVRYSNDQPVITGSPTFNAESVVFNESQGEVRFQVRIQDPNASDSNRPRMIIEDSGDASAAGYDVAAGRYLEPVRAPQRDGDSWTAEYLLDVRALAQINRGEAGSNGRFTAGFNMGVLSTASNLFSPIWSPSFVVNVEEAGE